ncbi:MAG: hypothetical protein WBA65_06860 [Rhodanobacter sp.]|jgi:hypothetical protein
MIDLAERRRAANRDLRALDEAHRLGRITRAEYRARRRRLLETLYDPSAVVTARNTLVPPSATTTPRVRKASAAPRADGADSASHALTTLLAMRPAARWKPLWIGLLLVVALAALAYWLLRG